MPPVLLQLLAWLAGCTPVVIVTMSVLYLTYLSDMAIVLVSMFPCGCYACVSLVVAMLFFFCVCAVI